MANLIKTKKNPILLNEADYLLSAEDKDGYALSLFSNASAKNLDLLFLISLFNEEDIGLDAMLKALFYTVSIKETGENGMENLIRTAKIFSQETTGDEKSPTIILEQLKEEELKYSGNYSSFLSYSAKALEPTMNDVLGKENFKKILEALKEEEKNVIIYEEENTKNFSSPVVPSTTDREDLPIKTREGIIGTDDFFIGVEECLAISLVGLESSTLFESERKSIQEDFIPNKESKNTHRIEDEMIFSDKRFIMSDMTLTEERIEKISKDFKTKKIKIYGLE